MTNPRSSMEHHQNLIRWQGGDTRFGKLQFLRPHTVNRSLWRCSCGDERLYKATAIFRGDIRSCPACNGRKPTTTSQDNGVR